MDQFFPCRIVVGLASLAFGMGTVEPHLVNLAVFGQKLEKLIEEIFVVVVNAVERESSLVGKRTVFDLTRDGAGSLLAEISVKAFRILYLIEIGGREIYAKLKAVFTA